MNIQSHDIDALIELFEASHWDEMHLRIEDFELVLSKDPQSQLTAGLTSPSPTVAAGAASAPAAAVGGLLPGNPPLPVRAPSNWVAVTAPNLGTFYRAPKPGSAAFVEIGQAVNAETEMCLIEVMKLFTTLRAGVTGIVKQVCAEDAAMVEFGDTLFFIEPA